jgi:hypothetical protein
VATYTGLGQPIDSAFVTQAVGLFDKAFPHAATDYGNLFRNVLYWTDAEDFTGAIQPFRSQLPSTYTYSASPILNAPKHLARALSGEHLPVILVTRQHEATLRYLRQQLPALRPHRLRPEDSFVLSTTGPNGPLILVNVHDPAQLTAAAKLLEKQGHLDAKAPLVLL